MDHAQEQGLSERRACRLVNQPRVTQRYRPTQREDEDALTKAIIDLASRYGTLWVSPDHGAAEARRLGGRQGPGGAHRHPSDQNRSPGAPGIWRREGLKVPKRQKPRGRLWLNDGSCVSLRPERVNHVRGYDFVSAKTYDGRTVQMLNLINEHSRECPLVSAERNWYSARVIEALADTMVIKGVPEHLRSDNAPEFMARNLRKWLADTGAKTLYIEPGSPWENGYCESFNSKLRDEFRNGDLFYSMKEIRVLAERWRVHSNTVRP